MRLRTSQERPRLRRNVTAARIAGAAIGFANAGRTGVVDVADALSGQNHILTVGAGIAMLVTFDEDVPNSEVENARKAAINRIAQL